MDRGFTLKRCANEGFTLIELIVTMGLIAVLSAGVVSVIGQGPRQYSRDSKRQGDLEVIRSALEMYRNDLGGYPSSTGPLSPTYLTAGWPADPSAGRQYGYAPSGCAGALCTGYSLCAAGEKIIVPAAPCGSCGGATCSIRVVNP